MSTYRVEVSWKKGKYELRLETTNAAQADMVYRGYNAHSGGNKRLKCDGVTIARVRTA
jgi:hypothetical protein